MKALILFSLLLSSTVFAAGSNDVIKYGQPTVYGSGCGNDGIQFTPSPNGTSFSVLFDGFTLETKKQLELKVCSIYIPIKVPKGRRLALQNLDLRGFMSLQAKTWGGAGVLPRFMNSKGKIHAGAWSIDWIMGPYQDDFTHTAELSPNVTSDCGGTQWLILDTFVGINSYQGPSAIENVSTLDSIDGAGLMKGSFKSQACLN